MPWCSLFSIAGLAWAAFSLARHPGSSSRFFVFGVGGSLLFVYRILEVTLSWRWLLYEFSSIADLALELLLLSLGLGVICWAAAMCHIDSKMPVDKADGDHSA